MRVRGPALAALAITVLTGCAAPRDLGRGDVAPLQGAALARWSSAAVGPEAAFSEAVEAKIIAGLGGRAAEMRPAYLVQVGVATAPSQVGVSLAAGPLTAEAWRAAPAKRRFWRREAPARIVTLAVVDAASGKTVAWSSTQARRDPPDVVAGRLLRALSPAGKP